MGRVMIRGYSRTRPVKVKGNHTGVNTTRIPPDGCKELTEIGFTICAAGPLTLWYVPSDISQ